MIHFRYSGVYSKCISVHIKVTGTLYFNQSISSVLSMFAGNFQCEELMEMHGINRLKFLLSLKRNTCDNSNKIISSVIYRDNGHHGEVTVRDYEQI